MSRVFSRSTRCFSVVTMAFLLGAASVAAAPDVQVNEGEVIVSGFEPGGEIVLVGVDRGVGRSGSIRVTPVAVLEHDEDLDGIVRYRGEVSLRSVWVAVDYATGAYAISAPEEFGLRQRRLGSSSLKKDAAGDILALVDERPRLFLVLIRPRKGAWGIYGIEGSRSDGDGSPNGKLQMSFDSLIELKPGKDKPPSKLANDDVIVGIDPGRLDLFTMTVGK